MAEARKLSNSEPTVGALLQYWRKVRRLSQLGLATEAEISSRHLCFIETGRSNPSREMVLLLASVLDVPLRDRNALLLAAGFAPVFLESALDAPGLAQVRGALDAILRQQEPFPAVVMDRRWDILFTNDAATRFFQMLLGPTARESSVRANVLRMMFDPALVRPYVANWESVAEALIRRVHRESVAGVGDETTRELLAEVMQYPGVAQAWRTANPSAALLPIVPVSFEKEGRRYNFFSTVTTLGTPQDITVQELRIECFFPVDEASDRAARKLRALP